MVAKILGVHAAHAHHGAKACGRNRKCFYVALEYIAHSCTITIAAHV